jgi:TonB family protein
MKNEKILVVEFEESSLSSLSETLQTEGFQVVTAKDGHEGLLMFESENPDLVILEPMLLKLHGFDLCRKITKDSNRKTPVIITTGFYKGEHYKTEALDTFGAAAFFEKPVKDEDLLIAIHDLLGNGTSESVKEVKEGVNEKKHDTMDIEESVREMEKSIREHETGTGEQKKKCTETEKKKDKIGITSEVDEMLKDALGDFGLSVGKKPSIKRMEKIESREEIRNVKPPADQEETMDLELGLEAGEVQQEVEKEEETELRTEELIEELIQKEEESEETAQPEAKAEVQFPEEMEEIKEEEIQEEEIKEEIREEANEEGEEGEEKVLEDYFEEPDKAPIKKNLFGFLKKIKKSLPLMIGSTAFIVLVAAGATYYFLKPNKSQALPSQEKTQTLGSVERSTQISQEQEPSSASLTTQRDESRGDQTGGPSLEAAGENPNDSSSFEDETIGEVMEPESRTEFMSTTGLSSRQRQVMLPGETASPESRKFEVIEVEETDEEQLGDSSVEISTPQLQEAVKSIIQNENTPDRVKTGDLLPIDSVDVPPIATKKINPKYPPAAYRQGLEETVVFRALISEFGNVLDVAFVDPTKTAPAFKKVCEEAVRQWRFTPAKKDGVNVKVWKTFSIAFKKNKTE